MGICTREYFRSFVYQLWGHIFNIILTFRSALYKGENVSAPVENMCIMGLFLKRFVL